MQVIVPVTWTPEEYLIAQKQSCISRPHRCPNCSFALVHAMLSDVASGMNSDAWSINDVSDSFADSIEQYLAALHARHYSERTIYSRKMMLSYLRQFSLLRGITQPAEVTSSLLLEYQSALRDRLKRNGEPLALATQIQRLITIGEFFKYLHEQRVLHNNPASDLKMPPAARRLPKSLLTDEDVKKLLHHPNIRRTRGLRDRAILEVLYSTGIRRQELCQLNVAHVDFTTRTVRIDLGKGARDRVVPIGERALEWVSKYLRRARHRLSSTEQQLALFLNPDGTRLKPGALGSHVSRLIRKALPGKTGGCHALRHAFATALLRNGCDVRHIQAMLGHAKIETTVLYTHVCVPELVEAHRRFHPMAEPEPRIYSMAHAIGDKRRLGEILFEVRAIQRRLSEITTILGFVPFPPNNAAPAPRAPDACPT